MRVPSKAPTWRLILTASRFVLALAVVCPTPARCDGPAASPQDYDGEHRQVANLTAPALSAALAAVQSVRSGSDLTSSLEADDLNPRLAKLLQWVVRDYAKSGDLRLLSAVPEGVNGAGVTNARLQILRKTYWLQDNSLYGAGALQQYAPSLGRILADSWRTKWEDKYPLFCPDTESDVVIGEMPAYDGGRGHGDPRCAISAPGVWAMLRMHQYPRPGDPNFDARPTPIVGTDYPGDESGQGAKIAPIAKTATRDLLKYGCLRQVVLGHIGAARDMFDLALAQWDGNGFINTSRRGDANKGMYWTRDLAFAMLCANALGDGAAPLWGSKMKVPKQTIEERLWSTQSPSGGIWTNYCNGPTTTACDGSLIPTKAKQTNEIAPLVLLAYGRNVWAHSNSRTPQ